MLGNILKLYLQKQGPKCGILRSRTHVTGSWPSFGCDYLVTHVYLCWDLGTVAWNMKEKKKGKKGRGSNLSRALSLLKSKFSSLISGRSLFMPRAIKVLGRFSSFLFCLWGHLSTTNQSLPVFRFWNTGAGAGEISQEDHSECTVICKSSDSDFIPFLHFDETFLLQLLRF